MFGLEFFEFGGHLIEWVYHRRQMHQRVEMLLQRHPHLAPSARWFTVQYCDKSAYEALRLTTQWKSRGILAVAQWRAAYWRSEGLEFVHELLLDLRSSSIMLAERPPWYDFMPLTVEVTCNETQHFFVATYSLNGMISKGITRRLSRTLTKAQPHRRLTATARPS